MQDGYVRGLPRFLLQLEGGCILLAALLGYAWIGQSWWIFVVLLLAPDASMLGYLASPRLGAITYHTAHSLTGPLLVLCAGGAFRTHLTEGLALIWLAHIGLDRALGYGLKYVTGFGDTHLGPLGGDRVKKRVRFCRA